MQRSPRVHRCEVDDAAQDALAPLRIVDRLEFVEYSVCILSWVRALVGAQTGLTGERSEHGRGLMLIKHTLILRPRERRENASDGSPLGDAQRGLSDRVTSTTITRVDERKIRLPLRGRALEAQLQEAESCDWVGRNVTREPTWVRKHLARASRVGEGSLSLFDK